MFEGAVKQENKQNKKTKKSKKIKKAGVDAGLDAGLCNISAFFLYATPA